MTYEGESRAFDAEILGLIEAWHARGESPGDAAFNSLALRLFAYQLRYNRPYARYCERLGVTPSALPSSWEEIPAVPAAAFKEAALATFDAERAALSFQTSGTTRGRAGQHYLETSSLYDAALLAGFDRFVLEDGARLRYLNLVPDPAEAPHSSLSYMLGRIGELRGDERTGWYLRGDDLLLDAFCSDVRAAIEERPVCIATTAFALVRLLDGMDRLGVRFALPQGSRVMETGGFKGRARVVDRQRLYAAASDRLALAADAIVSEYGMTELSSQYYDRAARGVAPADRRKLGPPWLRARVVGPDRKTLRDGVAGSLVHVDLANRSSCVAIQTEDVGVRFDDGFVLIGRERDAPPRGCSLDAEESAAIAAIAWM